MAKVIYNKQLGEYGYLGDLYTSVFNLELTTSTSKKAVYTDGVNGNKLILVGKDFKYDGADMEGGTITTIGFQDADGDRLATINKGKWDPQDLVTAYGIDGFDGMVQYVLKGKDSMLGSKISDALGGEAGADKIYGKNGDDIISGHGGNDKLWGGKGSDTFVFDLNGGHDKIYDFDAVGGGDDQDYLSLLNGMDYDIAKQGKNVVVDLGAEGSITLVGVKLADFDETDILLVM
ncbi:MAG: hypothetical protein KL863_09740 [Rhizobium sp.]|nr:hypothetical protein [Rhizobium sp.]